MPTESLDSQITAGARTVLHLQQHLEELRGRADENFARFLSQNRQYLTPSEDERTRQLLISYWHARLSLLGMVAEFRQYADLHKTARPTQRDRVFLVGFAAALMLVDAGRYLRDLCRPHPAIAARLNEPETAFGIPAGAYNMVQRNLTSPVNAWHLYHARCSFAQRHAELAASADGEELLEQVFALATRLAERVDVSAARYANARLRVRAGDVSRLMTEHTFGKAAAWVIEMSSRAIGKTFLRPGHRPSLPQRIREQLSPHLEPGDVLVTRKEFAATNYFLPGYWPHAILYLGDCQTLQSLGLHEHEHMQPRWQRLMELDAEEPRRVHEAMADGVRLRSIISAFSVDGIVHIRPQLTIQERITAIGRGLFHEGKPYDFDFDFTRSDRLVCTEVVYRSYESVGGLHFSLTPRVGRLTLAAEDLLRMALERRGFELLAVYVPHSEGLVTKSDAEFALRKTLRESVPC